MLTLQKIIFDLTKTAYFYLFICRLFVFSSLFNLKIWKDFMAAEKYFMHWFCPPHIFSNYILSRVFVWVCKCIQLLDGFVIFGHQNSSRLTIEHVNNVDLVSPIHLFVAVGSLQVTLWLTVNLFNFYVFFYLSSFVKKLQPRKDFRCVSLKPKYLPRSP